VARPEVTATRWPRCIGKDLRERLPLEVEVGPSVRHRGVERGVAEPLADGGEVDTGLEQVNGGCVPERVRMDAPTAQGCHGRAAGGHMSARRRHRPADEAVAGADFELGAVAAEPPSFG